MRGKDCGSEKLAYEHIIFSLHEIDRFFKAFPIMRRLNWNTMTIGIAFTLSGLLLGFAGSIGDRLPMQRISVFMDAFGILFVIGSLRVAHGFYGIRKLKARIQELDTSPSSALCDIAESIDRVLVVFDSSTAVAGYFRGLQVRFAVARVRVLRVRELSAPVCETWRDYHVPDELSQLWMSPLWMDSPAVAEAKLERREEVSDVGMG